MLDSCGHCGGPRCTQKCAACKLMLCRAHRLCAECDSDEHLVVYKDARDARRKKRIRTRRNGADR